MVVGASVQLMGELGGLRVRHNEPDSIPTPAILRQEPRESMLSPMESAKGKYTHVIAVLTAFQRIRAAIPVRRKRLEQLFIASHIQGKRRRRPCTVEGAMFKRFRGSRADRWSQVIWALAFAGSGALPGLSLSELPMGPFLQLLIVLPAGLEVSALGFLAMTTPRRYSKGNKRQAVQEGFDLLYRFFPGLALVWISFYS